MKGESADTEEMCIIKRALKKGEGGIRFHLLMKKSSRRTKFIVMYFIVAVSNLIRFSFVRFPRAISTAQFVHLLWID